MPSHGPSSVAGTRIKGDPKLKDRKSAKLGWDKPNGPPLPAFCPKCKSVFPSRNYDFGGAFFNAWDNEETCPECGNEHALLSEGIFDLTQETIRVLSAPDFTHAMLREAKEVSDQVLAGALNERTAIAEFEKVNPAFRRLWAKTPSFLYNASMLIATVVAAYYAWASYAHPNTASSPPAILDHATQGVLGELAHKTVTVLGVCEEVHPTDHRSAATNPAKSEAASNRMASKVINKRKPKAREIARQAARDRRRALCGRSSQRKT